MSHDAVQSIGALTGAEFAFYHVAVTDVLIRLPTGGFRHLRVLLGTAQNRSGELNATLLAPGDGFQVSVNLVCQHPRRVRAVQMLVFLCFGGCGANSMYPLTASICGNVLLTSP